MTKLTLQQEGDWIVFSSSNASFVSRVKLIAPISMRKYDTAARIWKVHYTKGPDLVGLATKFYIVDWGELPPAWQMLLAGGRSNVVMNTPPASTPHEVLHLLDTAPPLVVKAVYHALVVAYHPDHNDGVGEPQKLIEALEAYRKITS